MTRVELLAAAATVVVGLALHPLVLRVLRRRAVLDLPNDRSSHSIPTPRGAGLGVALAAGIGLAATAAISGWPTPGWRTVGILACCYLAAGIGLVDDLRQLPALYRLGAQVALTGVAIGLIVTSGTPMLRIPLALFVLVSWFGVVAYVNAFNFMDGINGISGLNAALVSAYYAWLAAGQHRHGVALIACGLLGASISFLPWNLPRAVMFLGDVGSYFLGFALGCVAVTLWLGGTGALLVAAPLAIYATDTGTTLVRRARAGKRLLDAHREHSYQRLSDRFGHTTASSITVVASLLCVAASIATRDVWAPAGLIGVVLICWTYVRVGASTGKEVASS